MKCSRRTVIKALSVVPLLALPSTDAFGADDKLRIERSEIQQAIKSVVEGAANDARQVGYTVSPVAVDRTTTRIIKSTEASLSETYALIPC